MITLILTIHLLFAGSYTIAASLLFIGALIRKAMPSALASVFGSFGGILVSGIGLIIVSPQSIAQFCVSAMVCTVIGAAIIAMYRQRVTTVHTA